MSRSPFAEDKNLSLSSKGIASLGASISISGAIATGGLFMEFYVPVCLKPEAYVNARVAADRKKVRSSKMLVASPTVNSATNLQDTTPAQRYLACLLLNSDVPKSRHGMAVLGSDNLLCYRYNLADREQRNFVLSKLVDICKTLGQKLSRTYVLPSLERLLDVDDATYPISKVIPQLFELCDGYKSAGNFTMLLQSLCGSADFVVAGEAIKGTKAILMEECTRIDTLLATTSAEPQYARQLAECSNQLQRKATLEGIRKEVLVSKSSLCRNVLPALHEMADSLWSGQRCAAAALLPSMAKLLGTEEAISRATTMYIELCEDPDVTVRRIAVAALHEWLPVVSSSEWMDFPLSLVTYFASEPKQDGVGINLALELVPLAQGIGKALTSRLLLAPTIRLARDVSWRVRYTIATSIGALIPSFSGNISALLPSILLLTRDEEVHVRAVAASQLGALTEFVDQGVTEGPLVDVLYDLAKDPSPEVRAAVAKAVSAVAVVCPPAVRVSLLTCVLASLINDTKSTLVQHAAINSITGLKVFREERGTQEVVSLLVAQLEEASKSSKWRVRQAVASQLNSFSEGTSWDFDELMPIFLRLLNDDVAAVRASAIDGFPKVALRLGTSWVKPKLTTLLPQMVYPDHTPKHFRRIQACVLLDNLLPYLDADLHTAYSNQQHTPLTSSTTTTTTTTPTSAPTKTTENVSSTVATTQRGTNEQLLDVLERVMEYLGNDPVPSVQDHFRDLLTSLDNKGVRVLRGQRDSLVARLVPKEVGPPSLTSPLTSPTVIPNANLPTAEPI